MPQYLVAMHFPDDYDPSTEDEATVREIYALIDEMDAAGVGLFAGASTAKSVRVQPNGEVLVTDGPYLETKEHVGGFSILEAADLDEILAWARKGAIVSRKPIEVREIFFKPSPKQLSGSDNAAGDAGLTDKIR